MTCPRAFRSGAALRCILLLCAVAGGAAAVEGREFGARASIEYIDDNSLAQRGFFYRWRSAPGRRLRWEVATGTFHEGGVDRFYLAGGPLWRYRHGRRWVLDVGIHPTLLEAGKFGNLDLGGFFHFTSFVSLGAAFGRDRSLLVTARLQHVSNARLNATNPGADQVGLELAYRF